MRKLSTKFFTFFLFTLSLTSLLVIPAFAAENQQSSASTTINVLSTDASEASSTVRENVREKVQEQIQALSQKPKASVGKLDQISDNSLQIETRDKDISLVSVDQNTLYFQVANGLKKQIKFENLVLGNFVVAMGFEDNKKTLQAERVITYDQAPTEDKVSFFGMVDETNKGVVTIKNPKTNQSMKITVDKETEITKSDQHQNFTSALFSEITVGSKIIAVGTIDSKDSNTLDAARIHILSR